MATEDVKPGGLPAILRNIVPLVEALGGAGMTADDMATLKARIEAAIADSAKEFGGGAHPGKPLARFTLGIDRAWALANHDDARAVLTDRAVKAMGGTSFTVSVDDVGVVIERVETPKAETEAVNPAPDA